MWVSTVISWEAGVEGLVVGYEAGPPGASRRGRWNEVTEWRVGLVPAWLEERFPALEVGDAGT